MALALNSHIEQVMPPFKSSAYTITGSSDSGSPKILRKIFSVNLPLKSWHNHFAAMQKRLIKQLNCLKGSGGKKHDGAASFQLQICLHAVLG